MHVTVESDQQCLSTIIFCFTFESICKSEIHDIVESDQQ